MQYAPSMVANWSHLNVHRWLGQGTLHCTYRESSAITSHIRALVAATWRLPTPLGVAWAVSSTSLAASPATLTSSRGSNGGWSAELSVGNGSGAVSTTVPSTMPDSLYPLYFTYFNPLSSPVRSVRLIKNDGYKFK
jgi:hypothetical protein